MRWNKLGLVWGPDSLSRPGFHTALQPTPFLLDDSTIRVFVGVRDSEGVSRIFRVDLDAGDPARVKDCSPSPVLDVGAPGCFDENGVVPCAVTKAGDTLRLYFAGYMTPKVARFIAYSGLAISSDNGMTFNRASRVPVMDRSNEEPLFRAIHSLLFEGNRWRVWYGAGEKFSEGKLKTLPNYNIRYIESRDGVTFPAAGKVILEVAGSEYRVGRPSVVRTSARDYLMFYGYGSETNPYRIGVAESKDGENWIRRDDKVGMELSPEGWDSEMMAYPSVIQTGSGWFMFYNGNNYGFDGFGAASLESRDLSL